MTNTVSPAMLFAEVQPPHSESMILLPCISLWLPWCFWVGLGWKTVETRTHARFAKLKGKRIGIHAARKWDKNAIAIARPYLTGGQILDTQEWLHVGGMVGWTAHVDDFRRLTPDDSKASLIECDTPRWGLFLSDVQRCHGVYTKGKQGIFYVEIPRELVFPAPSPAKEGSTAHE